MFIMKCKKCGSINLIKQGRHVNKKGIFQIYRCKDCGTIRLGEPLKEFETFEN